MNQGGEGEHRKEDTELHREAHEAYNREGLQDRGCSAPYKQNPLSSHPSRGKFSSP